MLVIAPWAFVGFDAVPQFSEEANFSHNHAKSIMDTCILCGCCVYIVLNMIAAFGFTDGYSDWVSYVDDLENLKGIAGIATFSAANKLLGRLGVLSISISALMAMLTGILGFYTATSRLLYSMAKYKILPSWFGVLNDNGVPFRSVMFCMGVSVLAPFIGRNALGWTVDMSSLGGAISLAYTSIAAAHFARNEGIKHIVIFGVMGFVFSVMLAFLLLVPVGLECSLDAPSYILLALWVILGAVFYRKTQTRA